MVDDMGVREDASGAVAVAVDGSDGSVAALAWAADQAVLTCRPLTIIHATHGRPMLRHDLASEAPPEDGSAILARARAIVEGRDRVPQTRSGIVVGYPPPALLDVSEHAFLLVVGSRGRGPVKSLLLGSVGVVLTQHARCPVVVHRPHGTEGGGLGILVGTDGVRHSEPAVEWACQQAALRELPLTLVRSFDDGTFVGPVSPGEQGYEVLWAQLDTVAQQFAHRHPSVEVSLRLEGGHPAEALARAAEGMDAVVVGTHVRRAVIRALEPNVTTRLLETAPCCVVVVPTDHG